MLVSPPPPPSPTQPLHMFTHISRSKSVADSTRGTGIWILTKDLPVSTWLPSNTTSQHMHMIGRIDTVIIMISSVHLEGAGLSEKSTNA